MIVSEQQHPAFPSSYVPHFFYLPHSSKLTICPSFCPDPKNPSSELAYQIRKWAETEWRQHYGRLPLYEMPSSFFCRSFGQFIRNYLPHPLDESILERIQELAESSPDFSRFLNRDLQSVIGNAQIQSRNAPRQICSLRPSLILRAYFDNSSLPSVLFSIDKIEVFGFTCIIQTICRSYLEPQRHSEAITSGKAWFASKPFDNINQRARLKYELGHFQWELISLYEWGDWAVKTCYQTNEISQNLIHPNQFVYPLILRKWHGTCASANWDGLKGVTTLIRKNLIALALQERGLVIHKCIEVREEFICSI
jgi:hypothetical protein